MLKTFSVTDIGKQRELNQDYVFSSEESIGNLSNVFIVADGMGGHNAGDYASRFTVDTMVGEIRRSFEKNPVKILENAIQSANRQLREKAAEDPKLFGMGTTVVAATLIGRYLQVANVGDSRLYVIDDQIRQITRDHSLVEDMVRMGGIDRETARTHLDKNIITRALGVDYRLDPDFTVMTVHPGDLLLLCSDGLYKSMAPDILQARMMDDKPLEEILDVFDFLCQKQGDDNYTAILIEIE